MFAVPGGPPELREYPLLVVGIRFHIGANKIPSKPERDTTTSARSSESDTGWPVGVRSPPGTKLDPRR
jgi:hypothetical protein